MRSNHLKAAVALFLAGIVAATVAVADSRGELGHRARETLDQFYSLHSMNRGLAQRAAGVLVFPRVTKGGLGVGGEHGDGVLFVDGQPAGYYNVSAASLGLTAGIARHSEVILFMDHHALDHFRDSHDWSIGADTDVAVISRGAGGEYDSDALNRPILAFMFGEHGLIGDVSLAGSKITQARPR
jgi:lipid-binding SYLF domain-containing protein